MPFGEYKDFDECVAKNSDKTNPAAYCGKIKAEIEGVKKECPCNSIQLLKSDDGHFYIYGPASIEIKDKEGDKIRASALETSLSQLLRRGRLSYYDHQDVIVGEIVPEATINGKIYKTQVTHDRMMVLGDIWDDTEASLEARQKSAAGILKSYSISGQIRKGGSARVCDDSGCFRDIFKIDQHAVTLCEDGMNPGAHYEVLQKGDSIQYKTFATENKDSITSSSEDEVHKIMAKPEPTPEIKPPETEVVKSPPVPSAAGDGNGGMEAQLKSIAGMMEKMMTMIQAGIGADASAGVHATQKATAVRESNTEVQKMREELDALKDQISKATPSTTPRPDAIKKENIVSPLDEIRKDPSRLDKMSLAEIRAIQED